MDRIRFISLFSLVISLPASMFAARQLTTTDVAVGQSLASAANVTLSDAAPSDGLEITLTSGNPSLVLLSKVPDAVGSASIVVTVEPGRTHTPDFYVYGLGNSGSVTYLVRAPGYANCTGTVRLAPSSIVIKGSYGLGNPMLVTTGGAAKITLYSAVIGPSGEYLDSQPVAGGLRVTVNMTSSNPHVGTISPSNVIIPAGSATATTSFQPLSVGETTLAAVAPRNFNSSPRYSMIATTVITPGISVTDQISIGRDLEIGGTLSLGQSAPSDGLRVTLTSNNPALLLISRKPEEIGSDSIELEVAPGGMRGMYYLQSLSDAGTVTYTASAPGFATRTATVRLTPSGVVMGLQPPDEADLFRKEAAEEEHGVSVSLAQNPSFPLTVYMAQLDPVNLRGADITVQALRAGFSTAVELKSSDPTVGTIGSNVNIKGGSASAVTPFIARKEGTTVISAVTPQRFTAARNATSLTVIVKR